MATYDIGIFQEKELNLVDAMIRRKIICLTKTKIYREKVNTANIGFRPDIITKLKL